MLVSILANFVVGIHRNILGVHLEASSEHTSECIVKQAGSMSFSEIWSVLQIVLRSVLERILRG